MLKNTLSAPYLLNGSLDLNQTVTDVSLEARKERIIFGELDLLQTEKEHINFW